VPFAYLVKIPRVLNIFPSFLGLRALERSELPDGGGAAIIIADAVLLLGLRVLGLVHLHSVRDEILL